ncbi:MAG: DHH family phosphoesterase, partial [Candidatus Peribacteraceae bacterium]|nr:DHH family phosphoesterase [Candidatus Peribacteraceae bacterium]
MGSEKIINNNVDLEKLHELFKSNGKKMLFYHRDADGVCSAAIMLKFFPDFISMPREGPAIEDSFYDNIISENPSLIVFVDMPVDQEWKKLLELKKDLPNINIVIIDHHIIEKDMNSEDGFVHINPRFIDKEAYIPAACVVYEVMKRMDNDVEPVMWISITGIIGDYGFEDCDWMFKEHAKISNVTTDELAHVSNMISSAITLKGINGAQIALQSLLESNDCNGILESEKMIKWNKIVQEEVKRITDDFEENKEKLDDKKVIFYEIKSNMNITSIIATITAERYPDYVV